MRESVFYLSNNFKWKEDSHGVEEKSSFRLISRGQGCLLTKVVECQNSYLESERSFALIVQNTQVK